jgi:hypothetical protein
MNLKYMEELAGVPNVGMIQNEIAYAAMIATEEMRRYGLTLPTQFPGGSGEPARHVPLFDDVDTYLRFMVADAYVGFQVAKQEAASSGVIPIHTVGGNNVIPDYEIEGLPEYDDPLFDVVITGMRDAPPGFLTVRISRRLTG